MRLITKTVGITAVLVTMLVFSGNAAALDILLTNDDGFDAPGITSVYDALVAAGHQVTLVAPAENQSGKGGSLNTNVFNFTPGVGAMQLTHFGGGVWSLAGTPSDSVSAGLDIVMRDDPPDLVVSGCNFGENIGMPGSQASGTEGAALRAAFSGIPAIACSVGLIISESGDDFPSTVAAFAPAADFMVRAIAALIDENGDQVLPNKTVMLNINFPVPYDEITGVETTELAEGSSINLPLFDPSEGFPAFGIPPLPFPSCAAAAAGGGACFATVGLAFPADAGSKTDLGAFQNMMITITPYSGDVTGPDNGISGALKKLAP
jgi:5'/3'-nucleotidase SurE